MLLATGVSGSEGSVLSGSTRPFTVSRAAAGGIDLVAWGCHETASALLASYIEHGTGMARLMIGPFACVVTDRRAGFIHLMRDRFGFVPMFYRVIEGTLFCSNSLKELAALAPRPGIDPAGLARYYLFLFVVPPLTLFAGVSQVAAGHRVTFHQGSVDTHAYDPFPVGNRHCACHGSLAGDVEAAVEEALRGATAPAVALSGGLDSAVVWASLPKGEASAFTLVSREHLPNLDAARSICRGAGRGLQTIEFGLEDFCLLPEFVEALDEPVCVAPLFYLFLLLRGVSGQADVVLLGEGGDELFLGYRHQIGLIERFLQTRLCGGARPSLRRSALQARWRELQSFISPHPQSEDEVFERAAACLPLEPESDSVNEFLDSLVCQELTCFPYFFAGARLGAWFGIDVRCPLLHRRVVDASFSLSWQALLAPELRQGITKLPLRRAFRERIPAEILDCPKRGFGEEWSGYRPIFGPAGDLRRIALKRLRDHGIPAPPKSRDLLWERLFLGLWLDQVARA